MASSRRDRKWVIRAMVVFVLILALLTFFSNTIMNATIPKVTGTNAVRGNLSHTNSAQSTVVVENKTDVKGIEGREVEKVLVGDYDYVNKGDTVVVLKDIEDQTELDDLQKQLLDLKRQAEYADRMPSDPTDYTSLREGITSASRQLEEANANLTAAKNKSATIAAAQDAIKKTEPTVVKLEAQVTSASDTVENINADISEAQSELATIETKINILVTIGTPTPTPIDPGQQDGTVDPKYDPDKDTTEMDDLCRQRDELNYKIAELESQKGDAETRLATLSSQYADAKAVLDEANATIEAANALPSVSEAQSAVNLAQSSLTQAQRAYSNAQINDGIAHDKEQDDIADRNKQIEKIEKDITKLEEKMNATEIKAPASGMIYGMSLMEGDVMTPTVIFTIIPDNPECTITFTFTTKSAESFYVGMELSADYYWLDKCIISNIKPDPQNPRESRLVKCDLVGDYFYPGDTITVTADRSNETYDFVVPSSAVNEDNSGQFVYVIKESSSPLGDKYEVKRVSITVENTDGSLSAIKPSSDGESLLNEGMIVTRSEKPLHDGDRVRLEDYSGEK